MKTKKQFKFKKAQTGRQNQPVDLIPTQDTFDPSKLPFSQTPGNLVKQKGKKNPVGDFFDVFNPLALGATAFANTVTDYKNRRDEQQQYLNYLQSRNYQNFNEEGLNPNPIYTQYGGEAIPYIEYNGERCTIPTYQVGGTYPMYQVGGTYPMYSLGGEPTLDLQTYPEYKDGGFGPYSRKEVLDYLKGWDGYSVAWMGKGGFNPGEVNAILNAGSVNGHKVTARQRKFFELVSKGKSPAEARAIINKQSPAEDNDADEAKTGGKWIPNNLHKGRCTPMGTAECPPGSPQYRLAQTFKKHHGFHQFGGHPMKMLPTDMFGNVQKYPYGGGPLTSEGAKEILRDGTVHGNPLTPAQKRYFGFVAGGGKPHQMGGASAPQIEEDGGNIKTPKFSFKKDIVHAPELGGYFKRKK